MVLACAADLAAFLAKNNYPLTVVGESNQVRPSGGGPEGLGLQSQEAQQPVTRAPKKLALMPVGVRAH